MLSTGMCSRFCEAKYSLNPISSWTTSSNFQDQNELSTWNEAILEGRNLQCGMFAIWTQPHLPSFITFVRQRWNTGCFGGSGCFRREDLYLSSENAGPQETWNTSKPHLSDTILALGVTTLLSQLGPTHHNKIDAVYKLCCPKSEFPTVQPTVWSLCTLQCCPIRPKQYICI